MKEKSTLNLKTYFGDDLHDYPESSADLKKFITIEEIEIQNLMGDEKFKRLSRLAGFYRLVGDYNNAHELFKKASLHFENTNSQMEIVNYLRWADVFRFEKKFDDCLDILKKAEKILSSHPIHDYHDFYTQHLGKFYFDKGEYQKALECFKDALDSRIKKGNPELIASTEFALKITKQKI